VDDPATIKWVHDHGLDRIVKKEKNLTSCISSPLKHME
jgi:hypothetical protein